MFEKESAEKIAEAKREETRLIQSGIQRDKAHRQELKEREEDFTRRLQEKDEKYDALSKEIAVV